MPKKIPKPDFLKRFSKCFSVNKYWDEVNDKWAISPIGHELNGGFNWDFENHDIQNSYWKEWFSDKKNSWWIHSWASQPYRNSSPEGKHWNGYMKGRGMNIQMHKKWDIPTRQNRQDRIPIWAGLTCKDSGAVISWDNSLSRTTGTGYYLDFKLTDEDKSVMQNIGNIYNVKSDGKRAKKWRWGDMLSLKRKGEWAEKRGFGYIGSALNWAWDNGDVYECEYCNDIYFEASEMVGDGPRPKAWRLPSKINGIETGSALTLNRLHPDMHKSGNCIIQNVICEHCNGQYTIGANGQYAYRELFEMKHGAGICSATEITCVHCNNTYTIGGGKAPSNKLGTNSWFPRWVFKSMPELLPLSWIEERTNPDNQEKTQSQFYAKPSYPNMDAFNKIHKGTATTPPLCKTGEMQKMSIREIRDLGWPWVTQKSKSRNVGRTKDGKVITEFGYQGTNFKGWEDWDKRYWVSFLGGNWEEEVEEEVEVRKVTKPEDVKAYLNKLKRENPNLYDEVLEEMFGAESFEAEIRKQNTDGIRLTIPIIEDRHDDKYNQNKIIERYKNEFNDTDIRWDNAYFKNKLSNVIKFLTFDQSDKEIVDKIIGELKANGYKVSKRKEHFHWLDYYGAESFEAEGKGNKQENSNHRELIAFYEDLEHLVYNTQFEGDYEDTLYYKIFEDDDDEQMKERGFEGGRGVFYIKEYLEIVKKLAPKLYNKVISKYNKNQILKAISNLDINNNFCESCGGDIDLDEEYNYYGYFVTGSQSPNPLDRAAMRSNDALGDIQLLYYGYCCEHCEEDYLQVMGTNELDWLVGEEATYYMIPEEDVEKSDEWQESFAAEGNKMKAAILRGIQAAIREEYVQFDGKADIAATVNMILRELGQLEGDTPIEQIEVSSGPAMQLDPYDVVAAMARAANQMVEINEEEMVCWDLEDRFLNSATKRLGWGLQGIFGIHALSAKVGGEPAWRVSGYPQAIETWFMLYNSLRLNLEKEVKRMKKADREGFYQAFSMHIRENQYVSKMIKENKNNREEAKKLSKECFPPPESKKWVTVEEGIASKAKKLSDALNPFRAETFNISEGQNIDYMRRNRVYSAPQDSKYAKYALNNPKMANKLDTDDIKVFAIGVLVGTLGTFVGNLMSDKYNERKALARVENYDTSPSPSTNSNNSNDAKNIKSSQNNTNINTI